MRATAPRLQPGTAAVAAVLLGAGGAVVWAARAVAQRGSSGLIEVLAAAAAPLVAWLAWTRPLLVPYGLYAVAAPLDVFTLVNRHEGTIARLLGLASAVALILYAVRTQRVRTPPRAVVWLALLCGWMALSTLWSIGADPGREALTLLQLAGLYLAVACFPMQRRDLIPLLGAILASGVVAAAIGIYEFRSEGFQQAQFLQAYNRINITFGQSALDPNLYGDGLLLPFAIALTWFVRARVLAGRALAAGALLAMLMALALAASREAAIGLAIEIVVLLTALRAWRRAVLPLSALVVGTLVAFPNVILRALADSGNGGSGRTSIWHVGAAAFLQHPFLGAGSGSFATVYDRWYLKIFQTYDDGWHRASHDLIVHYGVELGLVGLVLLVGWCASQWLMARDCSATFERSVLRRSRRLRSCRSSSTSSTRNSFGWRLGSSLKRERWRCSVSERENRTDRDARGIRASTRRLRGALSKGSQSRRLRLVGVAALVLCIDARPLERACGQPRRDVRGLLRTR